MRLTTWNCFWKFEEKSSVILKETHDIMIVQECSELSLQKLPDGYCGRWLHGAENHGLGMLCRKPYTITKVALSDLPSFACIDVDGPIPLRLIAVWNCPPKGTSYPAHLHNFLDLHEDWFNQETVVLAGDLNSQHAATTDKGRRRHQDFADRLKTKGLLDAYVTLRGSTENATPRVPTYRHRRSVEAPFHLDYIFAPASLLNKATGIQVGSTDDWNGQSDHSPVTLTLRDI